MGCSVFFGQIERRALPVEEHKNLKNRVCTDYPARLSVRIWFKAMWSLNVINARDAWPSASLYCRRDSRFFNFEPWEWLALGVWLPWWRIDSDNPHLTDRSTWQMFTNVAHRKQIEYMCTSCNGCDKYACVYVWHETCVNALKSNPPPDTTKMSFFLQIPEPSDCPDLHKYLGTTSTVPKIRPVIVRNCT